MESGGSVWTATEVSRYGGLGPGHRLLSGGAAFLLVVALGGGLLTLRSEQVHQFKQKSLQVFSLDLPAPPPEPTTPPEPQPEMAVIDVPRLEPPPTPPVIIPVRANAVPAAIPITTRPPSPTPAPPTAVASASAPAISAAPAQVQNPTCNIPRPNYPVRAKRLQQTGTVIIAMTIASDGQIMSQTIARSSGYAVLDSSALQAVSSGRCRSGAYATTVAANLPVAFSLDK